MWLVYLYKVTPPCSTTNSSNGRLKHDSIYAVLLNGEVSVELRNTFLLPVGGGVCAIQDLASHPCGECPRRWFGGCLCSREERR